MSKKRNTLFDYFIKSPQLKVETKGKIEEENVKPLVNLSPSKTPSNLCEDEDEEIIVKKKRRRVLCLDSDSDNENSGDKLNNSKKARTDNAPTFTKTKKARTDNVPTFTNADEKLMKNPMIETNLDLDETLVRKHKTFDFLQPENIKDRNSKRPSDNDYDPTTIFVPEKFLNQLTPGMRQWWEFKSRHFDCVLFFKVGKFYELYHMDADIGVKELGFNYMRGEFAHSGFPEVSYDKMSSILVEKGYKVARVEQTETPDMMAERCKAQSKVTKFDRVVKREICQITNKGTQVFGTQNQVVLNHVPNYMLSIVEKDLQGTSEYGICFIDTSIGEFFIGQFQDDKNSSRLLTLISHYFPVLVLIEKTTTTSRTNEILQTVLDKVLKERLHAQQFWAAEKTIKYLAENYYAKDGQSNWPNVIKNMQDTSDPLGLTPKESYKLCLKALGGCISYMKKCLLDEQVLSMCHFEFYQPPDCQMNIPNNENITTSDIKSRNYQQMVLDSVTLSNLRVIDSEYSLLSTLDNCCTKFGKRLLRNWICTPSYSRKDIEDRQNAITELVKNNDVLQTIRSTLNNLPDLERYLAQIHVFGNGSRLKNHPDGRAIFFEQKTYNKRKIQNFITTLNGFESLLTVPETFKNFESDLIIKLTQQKLFTIMKETIIFFKNAFDFNEALKEGVVAPEKGVDVEFDAVENSIEEIKSELKIYLKEQEKYFNCRLSYFGNDKKRFQLEVPENKAHKADKKYILEGQKKGNNPVRRFHTVETKDFLKRMIRLEDKKNEVLRDLSRRIYEKFSHNYEMWKSCVDSIAILDVLLSLAEYARNQDTVCIPEVIESDNYFIEVEDGYHPCMPSANYIPNGLGLGGMRTASLSLLTGPNMGGKSTLMRQIGLLVIMAQIGSYVPAKLMKLSLVDRIFTRLGAQDDILAGHSTFLVELNETASILHHASIRSLVLLDELGRGTATYDGTAIAASVVDFLANLNCRTIFSTHYHNLVEYFIADQRINLGHMACVVENNDISDVTQETVTFLYKYASGASPKSYGFNAAKLAGMPHCVIKRASQLSKIVEAKALRKKIASSVLCNKDVNQIKNLLLALHSCQV